MIALALSLLAGWQPGEVVVGDRLAAPALSAAADGTLHLTGGQSLGPVEAPVFRFGVRTAAPGAAFGPERPLETPGYEAVGAGVDAAGTTTVLLERDKRYAVSTGGAPPVALSVRRSRAADLAVAPGGAAVVAWLERDGGRWRVAAAMREGGAFGPAERVSGPVPGDTQIIAAVGSRGDALLAWTESSEYGKPGFAAVRRPGGRFRAPVEVTRRTARFLPSVGEDGTILLALSRQGPYDVRVFHGRLTRPQTIRCYSGLNAATVGPDGRALVLCQRRRLETWEGRGRLRRTARLPTGPLSGAAEVDLSADGSALVTWSRAGDGPYASDRVMAALRSGEGAFAAPVAITADFPAVEPVAARLLSGGGAVVIAETFGEGGRSMLAIRHVP